MAWKRKEENSRSFRGGSAARGDWGAPESQMTEILLGCLPNWIREVEKEI